MKKEKLKYPLEPTGEEMASLVDAVMDRLIPHVTSLDAQPASYCQEGITVRPENTAPDKGAGFNELLAHLFDFAIPTSFNTPGPGYLAYIPGGGVFSAAVAELIANGVNRYTGIWQAAPALVRLETDVIRWLCDMVGYGPSGLGFLTSGGSQANFSALFTARVNRLPEDFLKGTLYVSDQVHHSVLKAAKLVGFPSQNVRSIESDGKYRLKVDKLEQQIERDRRDGWRPFFVVASSGTTNTGAIDPLVDVGELCRELGLWMHVDAAYGGFFALTQRGRQALVGLEHADSLTLDPHKGLFLPYGTGCLLVKDGGLLKKAHHVEAAYLPPAEEHPERVDFAAISPELTRDFRGLRLWLPIKLHGLNAFRDQLDEKLDLISWACSELEAIEEVRLVARPQLTILAFQYVPRHLKGDIRAINELNRNLLAAINHKQRVMLTGTTLGDDFVIRICVLSFRTHRDHLEWALDDIREAIEDSSQC